MIGSNIKLLMNVRGISAKELAAKVGCTESAISRYVNNLRIPRLTILNEICAALGCTVDDIVKGGLRMKIKNDVIKALEVCSEVTGDGCDDCPYANHVCHKDGEDCVEVLMRDAARLLKGEDGDGV